MSAEVCQHLDAITEVKHAKARRCEECVKIGARWVHLRTCQSGGVTHCCDSPPDQPATKHARASGHPAVASAEPGERWLLVTSAMHMPRAVGVFQKAGFAVDAYPVDYRTTSTQDRWTLPTALMGGIGIMDQAVHEWSGLLIYWITGRIAVPFPGPMSAIRSRALSEKAHKH